MDKKKKAVKRAVKKMSVQDLKRAEMDPAMRYKLNQPNPVKGIITAKDRMLVRQFARVTLPVAQQRSSKITRAILEKNLIGVLKKVKPEMRTVMLTQMREYVSEQ